MNKYLIAAAFIAILTGLGISYTLAASRMPNLIDVNVTNWPPQKPDSQLIPLGRFNVTSGLFYRFDVPDWNNPINAYGYKKFSVLYDIFDLSPGNYKLNVSVATITWIIMRGPYSQEKVQMAHTSITRHAQGWDQMRPTIELTEIKAPYFSLGFQTQTDSPNWMNIWIAINAYVYLRN